jgi:hypothetical protein
MHIITAFRPAPDKLLASFVLAFTCITAMAAGPSSSGGAVGACPPSHVAHPVTEAPPFSWARKNVLWLGTSVPHQGHGINGYPELFCKLMGCKVTNNAFSGSHMRWFETGRDERCRTGRNAPKGLSATRRELLEKIEEASTITDSSYNPSCNKATNPLTMSYEHRINKPWSSKRFDIVVIDHGHNDRSPDPTRRQAALGTLDPLPIEILAIRKGRITELQLPEPHGLKANDDITIRTPGIAAMDYWTGEIASVDGSKVTLALDSSTWQGDYRSAGSLVRHDKTKLYDAYNLIISDIYHMNALYGGYPVQIVLMTPPTEWTHGRNDGSIAALNEALYRIAGKWGLPVYDMTAELNIGPDNLRTLLPDTVHPTTTAARQAIANHIADWAKGASSINANCP